MRNRDTTSATKRGKELYFERVVKYNLNPNRCKYCGNSLPYDKRLNKFCKHECYGINKIHNPNPLCEICGDAATSRSKRTCGRIQCVYELKKRTWRKIFDEKIYHQILEKRPVSPKSLRKYYINLRGYICEKCGLSVWNNMPIPLDIHHIDGNSNNNVNSNIEISCKNCHAQTDTYGSKNKGNGRAMRYKNASGGN